MEWASTGRRSGSPSGPEALGACLTPPPGSGSSPGCPACSRGRKRKIKCQTKIGAYGRRVLKAKSTQTGTSDIKRDRAIKKRAMQPGKRRSASGRIYYESRKNRSDLRGSRV